MSIPQSQSQSQPQPQAQSQPQAQPQAQPPNPEPPAPPPFDPLLSPELSAKVEVYQKWLSPPDPSINHGIAHRIHHEETSQWFIQGDDFKAWKSDGSLFWVHGKTGAGKTILTSAVIENLKPLCAEGASLAYFYCDWRDPAERRVRNLVSSVLLQLGAQSDSRRDVLHGLYLTCGNGAQQPTNDRLLRCLKAMLPVSIQDTTYIIIDALDECLSFNIQPPREVVRLIQALVGLKRQDLRILATSLPEPDIHNPLHPLTSQSVSLHEAQGHRDDIVHYIKWCIAENRRMKRWRQEDKVSTWEVLSEKAAGSWRWVMCQIRILPGCLPATVQNVLERFNPILDATYGRVMQRVPNENWEHAHRMYQFLAASVRPLLVDELSEILSIDYDTGTTPKYEAIWHPETPAADIFTVCHNLVTVDNINGIPTVQFAHVSVPNLLFSDRIIAEFVTDRVRRYHCNIQNSHWVAAQTCIASLLHFDDKLPVELNRESVKIFTMANYAAQHWVHHARFGNVAERDDIRLGIERIFDQELTFNAWIWIHDIDNPERESMPTERPTKPAPTPLYYAALCGLPRLVEHLATKDPDSVNVPGGSFSTPLHAASAKGNLAVVQILIELGAETTACDSQDRTPSQVAMASGQYAVAQLLEQYDVI